MNKELFVNAKDLLGTARMAMAECITDAVRANGGDYDLDEMPLTYTDEGEAHTVYADGLFWDKEAKIVKVGVIWYDENGDIEKGNEELFNLSANELYDIMIKMNNDNE